MKYRVTIDGTEREVLVQITPGGDISASVDGEPFAGDIRPIDGGVSLRFGGEGGGRVVEAFVGGKPSRMQVAAGAIRTVAAVESERDRAKKSRGGGAAAGKELRAPMPGRIVKVLVKPGDEVAADQSLVIIEAMKMENELRAVGPAKVKSVDVSEGQNVEGDVILVRFE